MAPGIAVAESTKSRKETPKVLAHLELHPQLGGGHIVKHVYTGYQHEPKSVEFNKKGKAQGGEHIVSHLMKHGGLPAMGNAAEQGEEEEGE